MTQELPREGLRVSLPRQVGGRTDRAHLCIRHLLPGAEASPHPKETQGTQQEGQAWRWGQLSAGEWGVVEREAGRPRARFGQACHLWGCGVSTECDRGPGSVSEGAPVAGRQGRGPAREWVRPAAPPTTTISGLRARSQTVPGLRGYPSLVLPVPSRGSRSVTYRPSADLLNQRLSRSPCLRSPAAGRRPLSLRPTVAPPHDRHAPASDPAPLSSSRLPWGHASPGGCKFASLRAS